jgi:hypothetical protein
VALWSRRVGEGVREGLPRHRLLVDAIHALRQRDSGEWHYYHGGVANAPAYQVEICAFGYFPGDVALLRAYPWLGFGIGVIGTP